MDTTINYEDWGRIPYAAALDRQQQLFDSKVTRKLKGSTLIGQDFIVCEHDHVYTLGLHGKDSNMLIGKQMLQKINAQVFHINRGGDITYHGPGQITGYPSLDLDALHLGIRDYIHTVEQMVINVMASYGIQCTRLGGATGVWIDALGENPRKICAIGVKVSRGITMHGFALNVNTDLNYFSYINPCGFTDKGVTSMQKETGKEIDMPQVALALKDEFTSLVNH